MAKRACNFGVFVESLETKKQKALEERREIRIERAQLGFELLARGSADVPQPALPAGARIATHRLFKQNLRHFDRIAISQTGATQ